MTTLFTRILCATDFSKSAERGLLYASKLAADLRAELSLVHVDDSLWMTMGNLAPLNDLKKEGRERIEKELRALGLRHDLAGAQIEVLEGKAADLIEEKASSFGADLVVVGSHGPQGWERRHLGSVTEKLLHRLDVSMLVTPPGEEASSRASLEKILLAVDLGATSERTVSAAVELARRYRSKLFVLHVAPPADDLFPGSGGFWSAPELADLEARLEASRSSAMEKVLPASAAAEIDSESMIREGVPYEVIASTAREEKADLLVLGAHGQGRSEAGWLGSTAHKVLRTGACPTLVVKP